MAFFDCHHFRSRHCGNKWLQSNNNLIGWAPFVGWWLNFTIYLCPNKSNVIHCGLWMKGRATLRLSWLSWRRDANGGRFRESSSPAGAPPGRRPPLLPDSVQRELADNVTLEKGLNWELLLGSPNSKGHLCFRFLFGTFSVGGWGLFPFSDGERRLDWGRFRIYLSFHPEFSGKWATSRQSRLPSNQSPSYSP